MRRGSGENGRGQEATSLRDPSTDISVVSDAASERLTADGQAFTKGKPRSVEEVG